MIARLPTIQQEVQQRKLLYMGLYLLIWGEAANLRFMPECLCYIYHHVRCVLLFWIYFHILFFRLENNNSNNLAAYVKTFNVLVYSMGLCAGIKLCL
jgi:hypothetical protein